MVLTRTTAPEQIHGRTGMMGKQRQARTDTGRPVLFAALLATAMVLLLVALVVAPNLPVSLGVGLLLAAIALVGTGWLVAGPRL